MRRFRWSLGLLLCVLALASQAWGVKFVWLAGTLDTWVSSASTLANGARLLGSAVTITSAGYTKADCELVVPTFSAAVSANGSVALWLLRTVDGGANYGDGDASNDPARIPDVIFPLRTVSTAQRVIMSGIDLPPGLFKPLVRNDSGVTMNATWTVKCLSYIQQSN